MKYKDYYQTLGVSRDATQDAIKQAYRRLARKYHPDVSKEANAEMRFKEVAEAYEVLKDAEKRSAYDQFGDQWKAGQDFTPPPNWHAGFEFGGGGFSSARGFSDFFESLFGQAFGSSSVRHGGGVQSQGRDQHAKIVVSLEDAYHGVTRAITLQTSDRDSNGHVLTRPHTLNVKIPKGVMEGQRIRLAGQGAPGINGERRGDLYLEIAYHPHRLFRVEKRDIHIELPITPWEAGLGRAVKVPTLAGNVELKIPPGSQTGQKLRLRNRGLPGKPAGDQFVELKIVTPKPKTDSHRAIYEKMAREMPMNPRVDLEV